MNDNNVTMNFTIRSVLLSVHGQKMSTALERIAQIYLLLFVSLDQGHMSYFDQTGLSDFSDYFCSYCRSQSHISHNVGISKIIHCLHPVTSEVESRQGRPFHRSHQKCIRKRPFSGKKVPGYGCR